MPPGRCSPGPRRCPPTRELGIITVDTGVESAIETQYSSDYANGTVY